jgi:ribosome maturation factor RimP
MWGSFPTFFCSWSRCPTPRHDVSDSLEVIVQTALDPLGFELVELRRGGTKNRPVIDVRMDRLDQQKVSVEDCAKASRAIEARLDAGDVAGTQYVLQVSSPGVERVLRHAADWRRFVGEQANIVSDEVGGRAEVGIVAVDGEPGAETAVIRMAKGEERRIALAGVREARLAFHWKR